MREYVGLDLGSRDAHRLLRSGRKPVADYQQQLIFEVHASERSEYVRRQKRRQGLIDLAWMPVDVQGRIADSNATVPEFVMLRHHEFRWRRIYRWFMVATGASIVMWATLNAQVAGFDNCVRGVVCPDRPFDIVDVVSLVSVALIAVTVAMFAWSARLHHRAEALEVEEARAANQAAISRTRGWRPPA